MWQEINGCDNESEQAVTNLFLAGFQRDLSKLRQLSQHIPVSIIIINIIIGNFKIIYNFFFKNSLHCQEYFFTRQQHE